MGDVITWSDFAALTALKQTTYVAMTQGGVVNATLNATRAGFVAIFGAGSATTTALSALAANHPATHFEALFSGAPVAGASVSTVFGQQVTPAEVQQAMLLA